MGYDLHIIRANGSDDINWKDEADVDQHYFRFNIWGMREVRALLAQEGTWETEDDGAAIRVQRRDGTWERTTERAEWAAVTNAAIRAPQDGDDNADWQRDRQDRPEEAWTEYEFRTDRLLRCRAVHEARIPICKFNSNDGWILSPSECSVLANNVRQALSAVTHDPDWHATLTAFAAFCDRAATMRGFSVW